jgi:polyisoprenoid-binding protein YceI
MQWNIDPAHSSIDFAVRHMAIATVRGRFADWSATVESDDNGALTRLDATIRADSLETGVEQRDAHLRSPDFLDAATHPELTFASTKIERTGEATYRVTGDLTIRGVSRPVTFDTEVSEQVVDPWGNTRRAAEASGTLSRTDWGLTWNQVLETGGLLVAEKVKFTITVEATADEPAVV